MSVCDEKSDMSVPTSVLDWAERDVMYDGF